MRSAKLAVAVAEHKAAVTAAVAEMRESGTSELAIAVYEAEQGVQEAKIGGAKVSVAPPPALWFSPPITDQAPRVYPGV